MISSDRKGKEDELNMIHKYANYKLLLRFPINKNLSTFIRSMNDVDIYSPGRHYNPYHSYNPSMTYVIGALEFLEWVTDYAENYEDVYRASLYECMLSDNVILYNTNPRLIVDEMGKYILMGYSIAKNESDDFYFDEYMKELVDLSKSSSSDNISSNL